MIEPAHSTFMMRRSVDACRPPIVCSAVGLLCGDGINTFVNPLSMLVLFQMLCIVFNSFER